MREVYLDNSATTKVSDRVAQAMIEAMTKYYGNPSSLHRKGIEAEKLLRRARETLASALKVKPQEIYFTSGGTESNNLAIKGAAHSMKRLGNHLITTAIEHPSVLDTFQQLEKEGFSVTYLGVDSQGFIRVDELKRALRPDTILVSIMYVNNEVGSVQPIEEAACLIHQNKNTLFHVDAVQAFGKIPLVPGLKGIDMLSMSGHKIYGPKGIGALFVREKVRINPLFNGGGQENGIRSGTENMPGIVGFGVAVEEAFNNLSLWQRTMYGLKKHLKERILKEIPWTVLNGPASPLDNCILRGNARVCDSAPRDNDGGDESSSNGDILSKGSKKMIEAPHILNISFLGTRGEILLHAMESHGIYVSTGSACSSHKGGESHVLFAMGKSPEEISGAIRFSLSPFLTREDMDYTVDALKREVEDVRKFSRK